MAHIPCSSYRTLSYMVEGPCSSYHTLSHTVFLPTQKLGWCLRRCRGNPATLMCAHVVGSHTPPGGAVVTHQLKRQLSPASDASAEVFNCMPWPIVRCRTPASCRF